MNPETPQCPETKPDLVTLLLQHVMAMAPGFSEAMARQIEADFRAQHAGERLVVLKRGPYLTPEQRRAVFADGKSAMSTAEIIAKHKISRSTLERQMKRGGRFSSD
jgi:hypothetical protein